jgi:hypothetical protein
MRAKTIIGMFAVVILVVAGWTSPVHALTGGSNQGGATTFFDGILTPNASGPKITGTLSVFTVPQTDPAVGICRDGGTVPQPLFVSYMTFRVDSDFFRDDGGYALLYSFGHVEENLCATDILYAVQGFEEFVNAQVVPVLYPKLTTAVLKSVTKFIPVGSGPTYSDIDPSFEFVLIDLEFAVK